VGIRGLWMLYEIDMLGGVSNGVAVEKMDTPVADNESLVFMIEMIISELLSQILGGADGISPVPHDHETSGIVDLVNCYNI